MKKEILFSLLFLLGAVTLFAQDDEIEEIEDPGMEELLNRPKDSGVKEADALKNSVFDLYDEVIATRKDAEENGYSGKGEKVMDYSKQVLPIGKDVFNLIRNRKQLKGGPMKKALAIKMLSFDTKKCISHINAHLKVMKAQIPPEEMAQVEAKEEDDQ